VEFNSALGPNKGVLRFHPSVFWHRQVLGFERVSRTPSPASRSAVQGRFRFDPKGRSTRDMLFCQTFMTELARHQGEYTDVPPATSASRREIGYMFAQYKRITNRFESGCYRKGLAWAVPVRPNRRLWVRQFRRADAEDPGQSFDGNKVIVSGRATSPSTHRKRLRAGRQVMPARTPTFFLGRGHRSCPASEIKEKRELA
jgi:glutamate dehydrogenase (NADP+)